MLQMEFSKKLSLLLLLIVFIRAQIPDEDDDPCLACNTEGTEFCESKFGAACKCNKQFMGPLCSETRNACEEGYQGSSGNTLCGQGTKGICVPKKGTEFYTCDCKNGYIDDPLNTHPDCTSKEEVATEETISEVESLLPKILAPCLVIFLLAWGIAGAIGIHHWLMRREKKEEVERCSSLKSIISQRSKRSLSSLIQQSKESLRDPTYSNYSRRLDDGSVLKSVKTHSIQSRK